MTTQSTIDKLIEMRLTSMSDAFRAQMDDYSGALWFFRKYPFSAFKHCHAYSIIIVVFLQEIIR